MLTPPSLDYYKDLTPGGEYKVNLHQEEACVALKIHDYGIEYLSDDEKQILYRLIAKLKDEIWP